MDGALLDGAFLIGGHGAEERRNHDHDMIVVPKDCIIVVLMQYGELMPRVKLVEILQKLYQLKKEGRGDILHDPLNHIPTLLEICGSFAIYQAGEECRNFDYQLFDCISATECYNVPTGVINLDTWSKPPTYADVENLHTWASPPRIIDHFSRPFRDSIYPTKEVIEDTVKKVIAQSNAQTPSFRKIYQEIKKKTDVTLSDILDVSKNDFKKRVFYHGLCRYKKDVTESLRSIINLKRTQNERKAPPVKRHPVKTIPSLQEDIKQIERLPLWGNASNPRAVSHTSNGKNRAITLKKKVISALKHRIEETAKHRTPHIKTWMNSPVYQSRKREEVRKKLLDIKSRLLFIKQHDDFFQGEIKRMASLLESDLPSEERVLVEAKQKEAQQNILIYSAELPLLHRERKNLEEWKRFMDAPLPPPISYVQENTRWKSDQENTTPESPHRHIIEAERYGKRQVRHSYANQLHGDTEQLRRMREGAHMESNAESDAKSDAEIKSLAYLNHVVLPDIRGSTNDREQLRRMREAHARFKKGRDEYMEEANAQGISESNEYEKNMAYMTNEIKGYERGIKQLEYVTNVVPPFHTSRVKIDKNEQLQGMRNAHARFTASRKKYMEDKASASDTNQYKKNMNYFNRVLRGYEKGIHQAEQPSNSYMRVNRNGTVKWIRK